MDVEVDQPWHEGAAAPFDDITRPGTQLVRVGADICGPMKSQLTRSGFRGPGDRARAVDHDHIPDRGVPAPEVHRGRPAMMGGLTVATARRSAAGRMTSTSRAERVMYP